MTAATIQANPTLHAKSALRRMYSEKPKSVAPTKKLRVVQLGSYPASNRGARSNLITIHERLQARGHESAVIDLTPYRRTKQPGVLYPRSTFELASLLLQIPADVIHLHLGSALTLPKIALAAIVNKLPDAKRVCTIHSGGRPDTKKSLHAWRWGPTAMIFRQFDGLIAINPESASFFEEIGAPVDRVHLITPFPRLRGAASVSLSDEIEHFCRQHTPLIASVGEFEPGYNLPKHFDILSRVRERYPSAGLIAIGSGNLHFKFMYARALHQDCNHIELTGTLPEVAAGELIRRANVLLHPNSNDNDSFAVREARKASTPIVRTGNGSRRLAAHSSVSGVEAASLQVLRSLQIARPQYEDAPAALTDGIDDVIRLYKQISATAQLEPAPLQAVYEWPNIGWGL